MPLTEQERRCVELAYLHLNTAQGGRWKIDDGPTLDEQYPTLPSPEVFASNGVISAAVEVKRLTGDSILNEYRESILSLRRHLVPSSGGHYIVDPCVDFRLPIDRRFRKLLKDEIERVAQSMGAGNKAALRIPRKAHIQIHKRSGPGYLFCCHSNTGHVVRKLSTKLTGTFFLDDCDQWEHSFLTEQAQHDFVQSVSATCNASSVGSVIPLEWYEEWEITRDNGDEDGVWMVAATDARDVYVAAEEAMESMVDRARQKFAQRRWADLHVLVLDRTTAVISLDLAKQVISSFDTNELRAIDVIFFADRAQVDQIWPT